MNTKKISILIPCYNVSRFVRQCLDSVVNQTYRNLEIICINDGSTDDTLEILREYAAEDQRITIIDKPNSGYGDSMNRGLEAATGDYVGIVESDDFIEAVMFETLMKEAVDHDLDIARACYFEYKTADDSNTLIENNYVTKNKVIKPLEDQSPFYQPPAIWAAIYRRSTLQKNDIKFLNTPGASFQDTSFAFKTYCCAESFKMIDAGLLHYRIDNANSSVNNPAKVFCVCDEYEEMWRFAKSHEHILRSVKHLIPILQLGTYAWNYNRLSTSLRAGFVQRWSKELREEIQFGYLNWKRFSVKKRILLWQIAYLPSLTKFRDHV